MEKEPLIEKKQNASVMRKAWFEFVKKTRKKMSRNSKETVSHRDAMKHASSGWAAEKAKLIRRQKREAKKNAK
jgi:hypothetical protein